MYDICLNQKMQMNLSSNLIIHKHAYSQNYLVSRNDRMINGIGDCLPKMMILIICRYPEVNSNAITFNYSKT